MSGSCGGRRRRSRVEVIVEILSAAWMALIRLGLCIVAIGILGVLIVI